MSQEFHWSPCISGNSLVVSETQGSSCEPGGCLVCSYCWNHNVRASDLHLKAEDVKQRALKAFVFPAIHPKQDVSADSVKHRPDFSYAGVIQPLSFSWIWFVNSAGHLVNHWSSHCIFRNTTHEVGGDPFMLPHLSVHL